MRGIAIAWNVHLSVSSREQLSVCLDGWLSFCAGWYYVTIRTRFVILCRFVQGPAFSE